MLSILAQSQQPHYLEYRGIQLEGGVRGGSVPEIGTELRGSRIQCARVRDSISELLSGPGDGFTVLILSGCSNYLAEKPLHHRGCLDFQ